MLVKSLDSVPSHLHSVAVKDDVIQRDNHSNMFAKRVGIISDASDHGFDLMKVSIVQRNIPFCQILIKYNARKADPSHLKQSLDLPEVFTVLLNQCTESDAALETLYELISQGNLSLIKTIIDKYQHYVSLNMWEDTWKTNNTIMEKCLKGKINIEIAHFLITMGFVAEFQLIRHFVVNNDEAETHSLISVGLLDQLSQNNMQNLFNTLLCQGHISNAETVRQLMIQKGYKFELILEINSETYTSRPLLMRVKLSKLYDVVSYVIQHCKSFNLIKDRFYEDNGRRSLPETVLSYLAFVKQFDAMKLIIGNPDCSFAPSHLVACSLFRGHRISRRFKLSLPIYDEIFDYLMRDDIRPRVLGDDKVWIDKSIFIAIRYGNERMVKKLVELGADLTNAFIVSRHYEYRSTYARYSLLSYACEYQTVSLVEFLIEKGVPVDGTMIDALGEPMIEMENIDMNDNHGNQPNHDDNDDEVGVDEDDADETNVGEADTDDDDDEEEEDEEEEDEDDDDDDDDDEVEVDANETNVGEADTDDDTDDDDDDEEEEEEEEEDDDDDDNGDDDDDDNEADVTKVNDNSDLDIKYKFYFPSGRLGEIKKSLYPQYFHIPKINRNRDFPCRFDYRRHQSESVYLLNMTPLCVAISKKKVDIVSLLLFHGANPMGKCMTNIPALFCLSSMEVEHVFLNSKYKNECSDVEIESRYPLKENKGNMTIKRAIDTHDEIESKIQPRHSHFTATLPETIKCVNIKAFLAEYSHKLECELHESDTTGPKRQRRCRLGRVEIANEGATNYTSNYANENEAAHPDSTNKNLIVNIPIQTTDGSTTNHATVTTRSSPHTSHFIYRNPTPELFQLLIDYGAPAEFDGKKFGATTPITGNDTENEVYSIESLLQMTRNYAECGTNVIIFLAKHNMISLQKFDELIHRCLTEITSGYDSKTERVMNACELLSAIIYPATDNLDKSATPLSTFDQKVVLTSGILDSVYSDHLYDIAMDRIYDWYDPNIEVFMRLTKAYPRFFYLNMQHSSGKSLLHHSDVVLTYNLVQLGFDVNYCTPLGDSLLRQTIKNVNTENIEIIYRLVIFGADVSSIGVGGVNCEQVLQKSSYPQSLKDFMKRCARIMGLLDIMNQYQSDKCVCLQRDDNKNACAHAENIERSSTSPSLTIPPFSRDDYDLVASSCVPEYTYDTLSYFFSSCSQNCTPAVCVSCKETLSKNDHCRPYQTMPSEDESCLLAMTYIHDRCFFMDLNTMVVECNAKSMETGFPRYIRNPTKKYSVPHI